MARAYAHTNIAFIKYWGKSDKGLNLPAVGSLSLTLADFGTETSVSFIEAEEDTLLFNGEMASAEEKKRVVRFLDLIRAKTRSHQKVQVITRNDVPTKAGLASSASGFAALALASSTAFGLTLSRSELSALARRGSGSAARSILGGFSYMNATLEDATCFAEPLSPHPTLASMKLIVVECDKGPKRISSREAMQRCVETSPFYPSWCHTHATDLEGAKRALVEGDFEQLGILTEYSTLKMHATLLGVQPGIWYFSPTTLIVMNWVRQVRETEHISCYFTMDAGPHVKILCMPTDAPALLQGLHHLPGVTNCHLTQAGPGAFLMKEHSP